jgi:hypothetical protein
MTAPTVVQDPSYIIPATNGGALYHNVELGELSLECINCPVKNPNIAGFDYLLNVELINNGNNIAESVDLAVSVKYPDNSIKYYDFKNNKLYINPGAYTFRFIVNDIGIDNSRNILPWALSRGIKTDIPIIINAEVSNNRGIDRKETRLKVTPQRSCKIVWNGIIPNYICEDLTPLTEEVQVNFDIPYNSANDKVSSTENIFTLSPELWAGGKFSA